MESLAAVDLGSNSFHMVIARVDHGGLQIVDRIREPVRLKAEWPPSLVLPPERPCAPVTL